MPQKSMYIVAGIALVAAAATFGDFIWYTVGVQHTMTAGVIHGALLLTTVGGVLGAASGRVVKGLPIGTLAGTGAALSYYGLIVAMDSRTYGTAIPGAWVIMWLLLAALDGRWLRAPSRRSRTAVAARGLAAAAASGVAFALVRNILWGRPPGEERNYLLQFIVWAFAWAPGLLALTWEPAGARDSGGRGREAPPAPDTGGDRARSLRASGASDGAGAATSITPDDLLARIESGDRLLIVDVRTQGEFAAGHLPGAVHIPFTRVLSGGEVPGSTDDEVFLYCGHGPRAHMAAMALRRRGRTRLTYVSGHFFGWRRAGLRVER